MTSWNWLRAGLCAALLAAGCGEGPLPCAGPSDCSGNACCFDVPISTGGGPIVYCTAAPSDCKPEQQVNLSRTRLCRSNADCTAGGIQTYEATCCPSSVVNRSAGTCKGGCLPR